MRDRIIIYTFIALIIFVLYDGFILQDIHNETSRQKLYAENYQYLLINIPISGEAMLMMIENMATTTVSKVLKR